MIALRKNLLLMLLLMIVGCASNKEIFEPVKLDVASNKAVDGKGTIKKDSGKESSVVYVYRPSKIANVMLTPDLSIPGVKKIAMANGVYKRVYLSSGVYAVRLHEIKGNTEAVEYELVMKKGKVSYLRVDASMKFEAGQSYQPYQRKFKLTNVTAKQAKLELAKCKDIDTLDNKKLVTTSEDGSASENSEGFSVKKTQNPFSR